jgi:NADPH:quinone reductase-like Zn-dependent oxidoreductase
MSPGTMRAVTVDAFGPPQNLRITPRPVPESGPDEISIDVAFAGVAHVRPAAVTRALTAVITLVARGVLSEPRPAVEPLEQAAAAHQAIADRRAPVKTVLSVAP